MRWAVRRSDELLEKELRMQWSFGREMNQRLWAFRLRRVDREGLEPWAAAAAKAPPFAESTVLALAYAYAQATEWHRRKPPLPS